MTLATLLDAGAAHDPEYGAGLSNHLPMALIALHRLGADDARLRQFAARYAARLAPAPAARAWPAGDAWGSRLGDRRAWPEYRDLFGQWLQHEDAGDVLRAALPRLMSGCGAAAFHGLIRTAYAVQAARRQELADALAYWACRWLDLGSPADGPGVTADPQAVLPQVPVPRVEPGATLIVQRLQAAAAQPAFARAVARLAVEASTLERLGRGAAQLYAASGDFTILHLLTSAHAVRVLTPWLDEPATAWRDYWRAWAAAWAASGATPAPQAPPDLPWDEIAARARASDDEHVVKAVDSCREQCAAYGGEVWRLAAGRAVVAA